MDNSNNKWKVLVTAPYLQSVIKNYQSIFTSHQIEVVVPPVSERMSEEELLKYIKDVDGILCGDDRITEAVLAQAPRLKVISKWGTGIDSIDKEAAQKRGIPVKNSPNAFTEPVADQVFNFMLCLARYTIELNEKMKAGVWEKKPGFTLKECTLGIVGFGNIGHAILKRAEAFGMKVLINDIKEIPGVAITPLDELLKQADFVTLNCDLNPTSRHLINAEKLALMKPTAFLINTSRGPVVDEKALIEALVNKKIAGAGLDVFEDEPLAGDNPLKKMSNVLLSPHNANAGRAAWQYVHENTIKNAIDELEKKNIVAIIPARMGSSRFPGKPLVKILGVPMVGHVYFRTKMSKTLSDVYIATCDEEIKQYAESIGAKCIMTKNTHERCSDRVAEALLKIENETGKKADIVVMIQGDEPMIFPEMIDLALAPMLKDDSVNIVNLMAPIKDRAEHDDPNCPKVVVDMNNFALYFSREPIPSWKKGAKEVPMLKQVCVIPFKRDFLLKFNELEPTPLEKIESVDMMRLLEHGYKVKMVLEDFVTYCVDTPDDLRRVEILMKEDQFYSSYKNNSKNI